MQTLELDDTNILRYVRLYINGLKDQLPPELKTLPLNEWNVSKVTNMAELFYTSDTTTHSGQFFNESLDLWDVRRVKNMTNMFSGCETFNQPLDMWVVSSVEHMGFMFGYCSSFNQPLNSWKVDLVKSMSGMFRECEKFNQPLDRWNVSNVKQMGRMFAGCLAFDQSLDSWKLAELDPTDDIADEVNVFRMFHDCPIATLPVWYYDKISRDEERKEAVNARSTREREAERAAVLAEAARVEAARQAEVARAEAARQADARVDPNQIHKYMAKVDKKRLFAFFRKYLSPETMETKVDLHGIGIGNLPFKTYIHDEFTEMISADFSDDEKTASNLKKGLKILMRQRLDNLDYEQFSPVLLQEMFYSLEYAKTQPRSFRQTYLTTVIGECFTAYIQNGFDELSPDTITCPLGAIERISVSLNEAVAYEIMEKGDDLPEEKTKEYNLYGSIISTKTVKSMIYHHAGYWVQNIGGLLRHTTEDRKMNEAERKEAFVKYMEEKLTEDMVELDTETKKKIADFADDRDMMGFGDDYFNGGGRSRRRKRVMTRKSVRTIKNLVKTRNRNRNRNRNRKSKRNRRSQRKKRCR